MFGKTMNLFFLKEEEEEEKEKGSYKNEECFIFIVTT